MVLEGNTHIALVIAVGVAARDLSLALDLAGAAVSVIEASRAASTSASIGRRWHGSGGTRVGHLIPRACAHRRRHTSSGRIVSASAPTASSGFSNGFINVVGSAAISGGLRLSDAADKGLDAILLYGMSGLEL